MGIHGFQFRPMSRRRRCFIWLQKYFKMKMSLGSILSVFVASVLLSHLHLSEVEGKRRMVDIFSEQPQLKNSSLRVDIAQCSDLPSRWARQASGINTNGRCVRLFDGMNCTGNSIEMMPASPAHHYLTAWKFNNKAMSLGPCRDPCSTQVTGIAPDAPFQIEMFSGQNYMGTNETIQVEGCERVHKAITLSVQTHGYCLQLYSTTNCNPVIGRTVELREGTPFHEALNYWDMKRTKSVSHCSFKCMSSLTLGVGDVVLYSEYNFKGNYTKIYLEDRECHNVNPEKANVTMSVQTGKKTCASLYIQPGCKGNSVDANETIWNLGTDKSHVHVRSVGSCVNTKANMNKETSSSSTLSTGEVAMTIIVIIAVVFLLVACLSCYFKKRYYNRYLGELNKLSEKEVKEFIDGFEMEALASESDTEATRNPNNYSVELLAQNKPYNNSYEVARHRIKFDPVAPLGMGEFGVVFKGTLTIENDQSEASTSKASYTFQTVPVAVKTAKTSAGLHGLRSLLKEVKVMLHTGNHLNIVHLLGCCTENLKDGEMLVLLEYCSNGSLESFLRNNRSSFANLDSRDKLELDDDLMETGSTSKLWYGSTDNADTLSAFDINRLMEWCIGVAGGMEFLANSKIVHSDLAARNVLLDDHLRAKISDFGLSRQLYNYSEYMKKHEEPLPWRWMAIESLKRLEFSTKSDVWSYGVLCWEIFTLGEKPYAALNWNEAFISYLEVGMRPAKPKYSTDEFYILMDACWNEDAEQRPSFTEIVKEIQGIMLSSNAI